MSAEESLKKHADLSSRKALASARLETVKHAFQSDELLRSSDVMTFCAGSLSRLESGKNSDLDIFIVSNGSDVPPLKTARILTRVADLNEKLGFPPFSDELRYMKIYSRKDIVEDTGKPRDDSENSFTTRMLLLLEGSSLCNQVLHDEVVTEICTNYFRDNKGKADFKPLFLINDLLRYWRTLCLNYEQCREDPDKPWRKKNVNLKFSRMTTVYSSVAVLMVDRPVSAQDFIPKISMTPLERLAYVVDRIGDPELACGFDEFLNHYSAFLRIKDSANPERFLKVKNTKENVRTSAVYVSDYFQKILLHKSLGEYSRYLLI
ncbi:hypothetical protein [Pseudoxanthomonas indica]|uniref:Nucleotidyltransferase domain-containing protein n=1 Tax=Pseudoxanthomonas indica TaxID=428993 RepID=A0A1T5LUH2_9GAMM|nr:hypothetical protein [Pseudoxanthomonas indica]GGD39635.1 hypothetical protein GCM10007235_09630 [Pseudoxanthomonas indica]SKC79583.1 hypothetical protein SAMN06296058_3091 [Pseudoxanthomonas indica]